ncbi:MAG: DUF350 domain-containing protein [Planctomycetota bacterium]
MILAILDPIADVLRPILSIVAVGAVSILMLMLALKSVGRVLPFDVNHEIEEDHNVAAAIVVGALVIGVALVIAAVARG